jgi:hypothetical protein
MVQQFVKFEEFWGTIRRDYKTFCRMYNAPDGSLLIEISQRSEHNAPTGYMSFKVAEKVTWVGDSKKG